ncbi:hypothetical protein GCM10011274_01960 [Paraglaciecola chathamensis]|jgi:hypothetical protein|uniref:Uncharacterized protein n=1 Tax=Paraglaciecola chathamensis TaxID=368405 RepID=A0A8H9LZ65_9ALTE|nr:hypothetical protein GCM10011274_01960 [Paraglaciecola oceanifecundans]
MAQNASFSHELPRDRNISTQLAARNWVKFLTPHSVEFYVLAITLLRFVIMLWASVIWNEPDENNKKSLY